jgi:PAS domain S-box-containing protein
MADHPLIFSLSHKSHAPKSSLRQVFPSVASVAPAQTPYNLPYAWDEAEQLYTKIFSNMTEVVLITDQSGLLLFISPNIERIIGYSQREIQERFETITQLLGENLFQHQILEIQQEIFNIERTIIDKSGQHHILSIDVKKVEIGKGKFFYSCRDITSEKLTAICLNQWDKQKNPQSSHSLLNSKFKRQNSPDKADALEEETCQCHSLSPPFNQKQQKRDRKLAEIALRESEEHYRRMIETTLEGVWIIDESNQTTLVNQRMASMLGYTREEMMGKEVFEFMDEDTQTIAQQYVARRRQGISEQYDLKLRHREGSEVWVIVSTTPIYSTQGQYIGALKMLTDITERKQAEKALQEQEAILRSFYDSSPLMMGVVELLEDDILHLSDNQTTAQFFGTTPNTMRNQLASHLGAPLTHIQQWIEHYKKSESTATPVRFEYQHCSATKSKWLSATVCFIGKMLNGRSRFSYLVEDITERKQAEETLRRQLAAVEAAMDGIGILNPQQEFIYLNQAHVKLFGYENSTELLGKTWHELYSSEQIQGFEQDIFPSLSKTRQWHGEAIAKKQDGSTFFEEVSLTLTQDGGLICVCRDITQRKQSEEQLRWEEALMRSMTEASPLAFYVVDNRTDRILYFNPRFCEIWGIKHLEQSMQQGELKNNDIIPACIPWLADVVAFAESCKPLQTEENRIVIEDEIPFVDGRTIRRFSAQVRDESDRYFGRLYVFEDVTERKQAEATLKAISQREHEKATQLELTLKELQHTQAQLVQKEKMASLGQLVAGVAHEINNPVSFIYGNLAPAREYAQDLLDLVELYQRYYPEPAPEIIEQIEQIEPDYIAEDFPQLLNSMQDGAERITQIVLSLRNFSRLDEKELKWVDIHEGIDSTLLILQHRLKQQPHRSEIQVFKQYENLPRIECYSSQLNQVFMNILSNAIDALEMRDEECKQIAGSHTHDAIPMIWICTEVVESNRVIIHITDNGLGITPDAQERLFDPFFTTKPPGKGTGLGLSISYQIVVERHRGKLWCHSTPEQGTEFMIELPITVS